jgi:c-di-GMP-binding flagellar brake protein YcgR
MVPTDPDNPSEPQQQERRRHPRTKIMVEVELHPEGTAAPLRARTTDLSLDGCYVEMMFTLEAGTKLKTALWINNVKMSTRGIVVTRHPQVGNGIQFTDMAAEDRVRLERFLATAQNAQSPRQPEDC